VEERRKQVRRESDRELLHIVAETRKSGDAEAQSARQRRRAIRHTSKAVVDMSLRYEMGGGGAVEEHTQPVPARVLDLSEGGAALFLKHPIAHGEKFRLTIKTYDGSAIAAMAEVRWSQHKESKGGYLIGVQFTHLDPNNREHLLRYLRELDENLGMEPE
jgi:c-di-GMP-binding flagellar brake protein YcgR